MERLTKETIGCFKYTLKDHKVKVGDFGEYNAFFDYSMAVKRLGEYEDTGLTPEQIQAQRQDIESLQRELNAEISVNEALTADKDEQAGQIMRMEEALRQTKTVINDLMACNEISKIADVRGEEAIKAIDALLGGAES